VSLALLLLLLHWLPMSTAKSAVAPACRIAKHHTRWGAASDAVSCNIPQVRHRTA
jgi:hypothetical protein